MGVLNFFMWQKFVILWGVVAAETKTPFTFSNLCSPHVSGDCYSNINEIKIHKFGTRFEGASIIERADMYYSVANVAGDSAKMILNGTSKTIETIPLTVGDNQKKVLRPSEYRDWSESLTITIEGTADLTKLEFESDGDIFNVFESDKLCLNVNSPNTPDHVELTDNGSCKMTDEPPLVEEKGFFDDWQWFHFLGAFAVGFTGLLILYLVTCKYIQKYQINQDMEGREDAEDRYSKFIDTVAENRDIDEAENYMEQEATIGRASRKQKNKRRERAIVTRLEEPWLSFGDIHNRYMY